MSNRTKKITMVAMLCAIAYASVVGKRNIGTILISLAVIATGILIALSMNNII